jgi:hypothetical protein
MVSCLSKAVAVAAHEQTLGEIAACSFMMSSSSNENRVKRSVRVRLMHAGTIAPGPRTLCGVKRARVQKHLQDQQQQQYSMSKQALAMEVGRSSIPARKKPVSSIQLLTRSTAQSSKATKRHPPPCVVMQALQQQLLTLQQAIKVVNRRQQQHLQLHLRQGWMMQQG